MINRPAQAIACNLPAPDPRPPGRPLRLRSPDLRRPDPRPGELLRGQIAHSPAAARPRATLTTLTLLVALTLLAACGKKGAPEPPGPPNQITYPKTYPTR